MRGGEANKLVLDLIQSHLASSPSLPNPPPRFEKLLRLRLPVALRFPSLPHPSLCFAADRQARYELRDGGHGDARTASGRHRNNGMQQPQLQQPHGQQAGDREGIVCCGADAKCAAATTTTECQQGGEVCGEGSGGGGHVPRRGS